MSAQALSSHRARLPLLCLTPVILALFFPPWRAARLDPEPQKPAPPAPEPAAPQEEPPPALELFLAPTSVPAGESWVILGSNETIPEDLTVSPQTEAVTVLEVSRLSSSAIAIRVNVKETASGPVLAFSSASRALALEKQVEVGSLPSLRSLPSNYSKGEEGVDRLHVKSGRFVYGYYPATVNGIAALRIFNRATGEWHRREHALEREIAEAKLAEALANLPPGIHVVDPEETLVDTDGDGTPDIDEPPPPVVSRPEFLGVAIAPGLNVLDIVAVDELGNASWESLEVER